MVFFTNFRIKVRDNKPTSASDECRDPCCDLCHELKQLYIPVYRYCPTYVQFMCQDCYNVHTVSALSRKHKVLQGPDMPRSQAEKPPRYEVCDSHFNMIKNLFCSQHKELVCLSCSKENHKGCFVTPVSEVVKGIGDTELSRFKDVLSQLKGIATSTKVVLGKSRSDAENIRKLLTAEAEKWSNTYINKIKSMLEKQKAGIGGTCNTRSSELTAKEAEVNDMLSSIDQCLGKVEPSAGQR